MIKLQQTTDSVKGGPDGCIFFFISDSGLIPKVKILTAIKKKRNKNPIEINITSHCGLNTHVE